MVSNHRRLSLFSGVVALLVVLFALGSGIAWAAGGHADTAAVPAASALKMLQDGNQRFMQDQALKLDLSTARRTVLAQGQHPFAVIVTCSDSRVPPELLFQQGLGDLFVVRVAGNVLDAIETGSVEYAVEHLQAKLVVVMGHEKCGAVKAAVDGGQLPPNIQAIAAKIQPAVVTAKGLAKTQDVYESAADVNVANMVAWLQKDPVLQHSKDVMIIGAKYHLASGHVEFMP